MLPNNLIKSRTKRDVSARGGLNRHPSHIGLKEDIISSYPTLVDHQCIGVITYRSREPRGVSIFSMELLVDGYLINWHWNLSVIEPPEIVPFSFGDTAINQGEFAQLTCVIRKGDKPLSITWSLKGDTISSDPAMTTTMLGQQTSILIISSVDYQHSGVYTCRAENPAGISTFSAELLVNGNYSNWHWKYLLF